MLLPKFLGGKTYFFVNYEGSRFPNVATYERTVALRRCCAPASSRWPMPAGKYQPYNLNPDAGDGQWRHLQAGARAAPASAIRAASA